MWFYWELKEVHKNCSCNDCVQSLKKVSKSEWLKEVIDFDKKDKEVSYFVHGWDRVFFLHWYLLDKQNALTWEENDWYDDVMIDKSILLNLKQDCEEIIDIYNSKQKDWKKEALKIMPQIKHIFKVSPKIWKYIKKSNTVLWLGATEYIWGFYCFTNEEREDFIKNDINLIDEYAIRILKETLESLSKLDLSDNLNITYYYSVY